MKIFFIFLFLGVTLGLDGQSPSKKESQMQVQNSDGTSLQYHDGHDGESMEIHFSKENSNSDHRLSKRMSQQSQSQRQSPGGTSNKLHQSQGQDIESHQRPTESHLETTQRHLETTQRTIETTQHHLETTQRTIEISTNDPIQRSTQETIQTPKPDQCSLGKFII